jgi:hypothetical protein
VASATLEHLLAFPVVSLCSHQAGCYRNNFLVTGIRDIGCRVGITIKKYDFSEPQHGKDLCDIIICPMKNSIRMYCNEGHDIDIDSDGYEEGNDGKTSTRNYSSCLYAQYNKVYSGSE